MITVQEERHATNFASMGGAITRHKLNQDGYVTDMSKVLGMEGTVVPESNSGGGTAKHGAFGIVAVGKRYTQGNMAGVPLPEVPAAAGQATLVSDWRDRSSTGEMPLQQMLHPEAGTTDKSDSTQLPQTAEPGLKEVIATLEQKIKELQQQPKEDTMAKTEPVTFELEIGQFSFKCSDIVVTPKACIVCYGLGENIYVPKPGTKMQIRFRDQTLAVEATDLSFEWPSADTGFVVLRRIL